jgi:ATP synthase F1 delta subunit
MDNIEILARRYAQAFMNTFSENLPPRLIEKLKELERYLQNNKSALFYFTIPFLKAEIKKEVLETICDKFELKNFLLPLITLLVKDNRFVLFEKIIYFLRELYKNLLNIIEWYVTSYPLLTEQELHEIEKFIESKTQKKAYFEYAEDKALIAGIRVKSDYFLWEHSIQQMLRALTNINGVDSGN